MALAVNDRRRRKMTDAPNKLITLTSMLGLAIFMKKWRLWLVCNDNRTVKLSIWNTTYILILICSLNWKHMTYLCLVKWFIRSLKLVFVTGFIVTSNIKEWTDVLSSLYCKESHGSGRKWPIGVKIYVSIEHLITCDLGRDNFTSWDVNSR